MGNVFLEKCLLLALLLASASITEVAGQPLDTGAANVTTEAGLDEVFETEVDGLMEEMEDEGLAGNNFTTATNGNHTGPDGINIDVNGTNVTAPTAAPTFGTMPPTTEDGCYTSLDAVYYVISDDDKLFEQKRFVLCPGTVADVGFLVPGIGIDKGQSPIVPRSNTEFLCGEDGDPKNNCVINGGDFGLIAVPVFFRQDLSVFNVHVRGFTFTGQVQYASFIATSGDINFYDCIFSDSGNFGTMVYNYDASLDLSRRLEAGDEEFKNPWDHVMTFVDRYRSGHVPRKLTAGEAEAKKLVHRSAEWERRGLQPAGSMDSLVHGCVFDNLNHVERKLGVEFGIFSVKGADHNITVEDTTFSNNLFGNQELTPIGYAMLFQGCDVKLSNLCFIDNDFRGNGIILLEETKDPFVEGTDMMSANYVTEEDGDLDCSFAAYFATDEDRRNSNFTCIPPQASECGGDHITIYRPEPEVLVTKNESGASCLWARFALAVGIICASVLL